MNCISRTSKKVIVSIVAIILICSCLFSISLAENRSVEDVHPFYGKTIDDVAAMEIYSGKKPDHPMTPTEYSLGNKMENKTTGVLPILRLL